MAEEKKKKSDKLYGDSPTVKRGDNGEPAVKKPSEEAAADVGVDSGPVNGENDAHEAERVSMHKRHEEEQKGMHERHAKDMKEMHKRHEKSGKAETGGEDIKKTENDKKESE